MPFVRSARRPSADGAAARWSQRREGVVGVTGCALVALATTYLTGPSGHALNAGAYLVVGVVGVAVGAYGAWRWRRRLGLVGVLLATSLLASLVGDAGWTLNSIVLDSDPFPAWTDAFYLVSYVCMTGAALLMVKRREARRDTAALIDATIVAVGVGVVAYAFIIVGAITDPDVTGLGRVVSVAYPVCDVLVAGVIARLLVSAGTASVPAVLLITAISALLLSDVGFAVAVFNGHEDSYPAWIDALYLVFYLLVGLALARPDAARLTEPVAEHSDRLGRGRLLALGVGTLLAPLTLLAGGVAGNVIKVRGAAVGAAVLFLLSMLRMVQLIRAVENQSELLQVLARTDGLTGLANRRTFDHEIHRAVDLARNDPRAAVVSVAMIDLDRFKMFNDTYGHSAGDQLLRQAATAWSAELERIAPVAMLARYGGEEFAVVLPGFDEAAAEAALRALLEVMPLGQSFSAGVAQHEADEDPAAVVGRADRRLYEAKAAGRARVIGGTPPDGATAPGLQRPAPIPTAAG